MDSGIYRIEMDDRWHLKDLYEFPHAFTQVYAFTYCFDTELSPRDAARIDYALENYPWAGGYSIVNIYQVLQNQVEHEYRPRIIEIRYASPGWIDLLLNLHPAVKVATSVAAFAGSLAAVTKSFSVLQKKLYEIRAEARKARIEQIQLTRSEIREIHGLTQDLANFIGFDKLDELNQRTGNIEVSAKLVSAHYRRMKILVDYALKGKAFLPEKPRDEG